MAIFCEILECYFPYISVYVLECNILDLTLCCPLSFLGDSSEMIIPLGVIVLTYSTWGWAWFRIGCFCWPPCHALLHPFLYESCDSHLNKSATIHHLPLVPVPSSFICAACLSGEVGEQSSALNASLPPLEDPLLYHAPHNPWGHAHVSTNTSVKTILKTTDGEYTLYSNFNMSRYIIKLKYSK